MARFVQSRKEASHERILDAAARAIRRHGYAGAGVADIMKEAGLTHGGFYAHFDSRDAMLAEAADRSGAQSVGTLAELADEAPPEQAFAVLAKAYLSTTHRERVDLGCPVAALGSEMPRQAAEVREAATQRMRDMIDLVQRHVKGQDRTQALSSTATMVGALIMARAVNDPALSDEVLAAALDTLIGR